MRNYSHIISKLFNEPTLLTPGRHAAICHLLEARLSTVHSPQSTGRIDSSMDDDENGGGDEDVKISGAVAIIPVHGTLVAHPEDIAMSECGCDMERLSQAIDMAEHDPRISTVVYDFRTPGGSVTGIPEAGRKILNSRKETIAFTDSECCSGGIWLAAQCQKFYATQSSRVGSVGVYTMCLDMTAAMKKDGIKVTAISAGKFKLLRAYWKSMSAEEVSIVQKGVDKIYTQFKEAMESHRVVKDENFGNGLIFDGDEAAEIGFTDGVVESMDDILENMVGD